jgi:murein DD-endopeptidase MepM/ murein hydrolase activator NlpD
MNPMKSILLALAIALQGPAAPPLEQGRELTSLLYQGKDAEVWSRFSDRMKQAIGKVENLAALRAQVAEQAGTEAAVIDERVEAVNGMSVYARIARYTKAPEPVMVQWTLSAGGVVEGFFIRPVPKEAPTDRLDYVTKTPLRLPFAGSWFVFWGGRTLKENYHTMAADQRFAYDIVMMRDGSSHRGQGRTNEEYYCYGQRILAPGPGTVVSVENGIEDNVPGAMNPKDPMGNHVIIDHGNGEFSFLAHFKKGTVTVKAGAVVKTSDLLGLAGNSGNSSEPHLHYHLQDTAVFRKGRGLPAPFEDYIADGKPVKHGEPVKGQTVANPSTRP